MYTDKRKVPELNACGTLITTFILVILLLHAYVIHSLTHSSVPLCLIVPGLLIDSIFFICALCCPSYISGNPGWIKMLPIFIGNTLVCYSIFLSMVGAEREPFPVIVAVPLAVLIYVLSTLMLWLLYIQDDFSIKYDSFMKPWVIRPKDDVFENLKQVRIQY